MGFLESIAAAIAQPDAATQGTAAIAQTGNGPTLDELVEATDERAAMADRAYDPVAPVFAAARPVLDDQMPDRMPPGTTSRTLRPPTPAASNAFAVTGLAGSPGLPVQVVPASGGRARRVVIRVGTEPVWIAPDSRSSPDSGTTADHSGLALPAAAEHVTSTQGPVYVAADAAWSVSVWVDHYGDPTADAS